MNTDNVIPLRLVVTQTADELVENGAPLKYYLYIFEGNGPHDGFQSGQECRITIVTDCLSSEKKATLRRIGATALSMLRHSGVRTLIDTETDTVWHI